MRKTLIGKTGVRNQSSATLSAVDRAESTRPLFVGSDVYRRAAFGTNHPLNIVRHAAVLDLAHILDWLPDTRFRSAAPATVEQILRFHNRDYVEALQYADSASCVAPSVREKFAIGTLENPLFPGLFERAATTVGGSIMAAELAADGHVVFHPSGGTHHGRPDRASGFCYFNDPVFAILTLQDRGYGRVMYIDLDAHHGDGVEDAFIGNPDVMTASIHEQDRWPYSGAAGVSLTDGTCNLPVPKGFSDSELDYLVRNTLLPLAETFAPDALVICCGADCLAGDPLSGMALSNIALWQVVAQLLELDKPAVILGGGGYNPWTVTRYWTGLWGHICGREMPRQLPEQAVTLLRGMECELIDEEDADPAWMLTIADVPDGATVVRDAVRLLAIDVASQL